MNVTPGTSWEVKARGHQCASTGKRFEDGQTLVSRLIPTADGLVREDFALDQWDDGKQGASRFYWRTTYHPPRPREEAPFREENAAEAVQELMAENDPANTNTLFILAAMLERKRLWIEKAVQTDDEGRKVRIYEQKDSGETYLIVDPGIQLEDLAALQQEVALKLGWIQADTPEPEQGEAPEEGADPEPQETS